MTQKSRNTDWLEFLDNLISEETNKLLAEGYHEEELSEAVQNGVEEVLATAPRLYVQSMKAKARKMLRDRRRLERNFQARSFKRWKPAFDRLETIWYSAEEVTSAFNTRYRAEAVENNDFTFEVLTRLNGRGLLAAAEVVHLLKGGYAEGALSRWRTLHEILVVAMFIREGGPVVAERYLASADFTRLEAATQLNYYAGRANLRPFSQSELIEFEERCSLWKERFGESLNNYNWARPGLDGGTDKRRITFFDLEQATGLDHWRPRYKWASQHTHAGHRDPGVELGLREAESEFILVGASNSGFVDPMQMTALHVASLSMTLLFTRPSTDTIALAKALNILAVDLGEIALKREDFTLRRNRSRRFFQKL